MALLRRAAAEPGVALSTALALLRGRWYLLWYRLRGRRVRAGRQFKVFGSLKVRGPGEVIFGDRVTILGDATPFTYKREARIIIGNDVMMGSARFGCASEISIGDQCILADCSISDTDHHSAQANRRSPDAPVRVLPVKIERNVWVARQAAVLPGCTVLAGYEARSSSVTERCVRASSLAMRGACGAVERIAGSTSMPPSLCMMAGSRGRACSDSGPATGFGATIPSSVEPKLGAGRACASGAGVKG